MGKQACLKAKEWIDWHKSDSRNNKNILKYSNSLCYISGNEDASAEELQRRAGAWNTESK